MTPSDTFRVVPSLAQLITRTAARHLGLDRTALARSALRFAARGLQQPPVTEPALPPAGALSSIVLYLWALAGALFLTVVVNADLLLPGQAPDVFRVAAGSLLVLVACGSLARRVGARDLLVGRLAGGAARRARRGLARAAVTVLGLAFLGLGVFDLVRGVAGLV